MQGGQEYVRRMEMNSFIIRNFATENMIDSRMYVCMYVFRTNQEDSCGGEEQGRAGQGMVAKKWSSKSSRRRFYRGR